MKDEGYIKFKVHWKEDALPEIEGLHPLFEWRACMHQHGLIGVYPDGIGFGNISIRVQADRFVISGSATGDLPQLGPEQLSLVERVDVERNEVFCRGPIVASSESMTHAMVYRALPWVKAVIHIHHRQMWDHWMYRLPITPPEVSYGSPEMARSVLQLLSRIPDQRPGLIVMGGHEEGLIAYGGDHEEAGRCVLNHLAALAGSK